MIKKLFDGTRPVILGRVKLGEWKKGEAPDRFDEFKIAKLARGSNNQMIEDLETKKHIKTLLKQKDADKLKRIPIYFSGNTIDEVFDCWYEMRWGARAYCIGNGETAKLAMVSVNGEAPKAIGTFTFPKKDDIKSVEIKDWVQKDCCDKGCKTYDPNPDNKSSCKMSCNMLFHIQGLTRRGGLFEFRSHSLHTTRNLLSGLKDFEQKLFGHLSLLPFELVLESQRTKRGAEIFIAHLEMVGELEQLRSKAIENAQNEMKYLTNIQKYRVDAKKMLTMQPEDISEEDGEAETQEFYGDTKIDVKEVDVKVLDAKPDDNQLF